jgi:hypothetical protein
MMCEIKLDLLAEELVNDDPDALPEKLRLSMANRSADFFDNMAFLAGIFLDPRYKFTEDSEVFTTLRRDLAIVS